MPHIKMTPRAQKTVNRDDCVVRKAIQLRLTPLEVFVQAYLSAGNAASSGEVIFYSQYKPNLEGKDYGIPKVVQQFCATPMPECSFSGCQNPKDPDRRPPYLVQAASGLNLYFCSGDCRNKHSNEDLEILAATTVAHGFGESIFEQISIAMSMATLVAVPESKIRFMPGQPRKFFDQSRLNDLAESMILTRGNSTDPVVTGQLMPGLIRRIPSNPEGFEYELLDGERRLRAVRIAGIQNYRAMLIELDDDSARHVVSVMANFNREGHTPLELSDTVVHFHDELGFPFAKIAQTIGKSMQHVRSMYQLKQLVPAVRDMLDPERTSKNKRLKVGAAVEIAKLGAHEQLRMAQQAVSDNMRLGEVRENVARHTNGTKEVSTRTISAEERLKQLEALLRRHSTAVGPLHTALERIEEYGISDIIEPEDVKDWLVILEEQMVKLTSHIDRLKSIKVRMSEVV